MKFSGIIATLAVSGAATAAVIPRDQVVSPTIQGTLVQLNTVLGSLQSLAQNNVNGVANTADVAGIKSELDGIKSQLATLAGQTTQATKRDLVTGAVGTVTGTVDSVAGPVITPVDQLAGNAVGTVEGAAGAVASPLLDTLGSVTGGVAKRDTVTVDVSGLLPLAQTVVTDIENKVPVNTLVNDVNTLVHGISVTVNVPLNVPVSN
ncbi:hypothetical protein VTN77DRAFT_7236 [Rasamsonia byssochlamydoides]|uniref:uncharacterized protein n=1 Tax=Rasamsonia byssochlamydoides TaxID=89139 RepID=UPI003742FBD7